MDHVLYFYFILENSQPDSYTHSNILFTRFKEQLDTIYPGEKIKRIKVTPERQYVFDAMWKNRRVYDMRREAIGLTELSAPRAYAALKTLAAGQHWRIINDAKKGIVKNMTLYNGLIVTFTTLDLGTVKPSGMPVEDYVAMVNVDDYEMLIDALRSTKTASETNNRRRQNSASFQKVTSAGFWEKVKNVKKMENGEVHYGDMSNSEIHKFIRLKKEGRLEFDRKTGRVYAIEHVREYLIPSFAEYCRLISN